MAAERAAPANRDGDVRPVAAHRVGLAVLPAHQPVMRASQGKQGCCLVGRIRVGLDGSQRVSLVGVAPVQLIVPVGLEDKTEILPGMEAQTWHAAMWVTGERDYPGWADLDAEGKPYSMTPGPIMSLFRHHQDLVNQWSNAFHELALIQEHPDQAGSLEAEDGFPRSEQGLRRDIEMAKATLRVVRQEIRNRSLTPPPLPDQLARLDEEEPRYFRGQH